MQITRSIKDILDSIVITKKTVNFVHSLYKTYGNIIIRNESDRSPIKGFARLEDNSIIYIEGYIKKLGDNLILPIRVVTLPSDFKFEPNNSQIDYEGISNILNKATK